MNSFKKILKNERGVALMMIMTSIILLMAIYGEFTFDSKISRLKATNIMDRAQAKLLADSGLQMAMARLRLYKEAFNYIQGNANAKAAVPAQLINQLWEVPFIFPIPIGKQADRLLKDSVEKFSKESLLEGEFRVSIQNLSNRMNLNMLRIDMTKFDPNNANAVQEAHSSQLNQSDTAINTDVSLDQTLYFLLKRQVELKKDKDEGFEDRNGNINYQELVTHLKYYMSDYQSMSQDPLAGEAEQEFQQIPLAPKFGPLSNMSELYAIPGWNDELIELIQNEFSVYPSTQIDFNKISANMLKVLIPTMSDEDIRQFFEYRDDPQKPRYFNSLQDFKTYIVDQNNIVGSGIFDERMTLFQQKGITFGSSPNLFKVVSEGTYNRSTYTLVATVILPQPATTTPTAGVAGGATTGVAGGVNAGVNSGAGVAGGATAGSTAGSTTTGATAGATGGTTAGAQTTQLQDPRIIDIQIN